MRSRVREIHRPSLVGDQGASALRLDDPCSRALLAALLIFHVLPRGFANRDLREHIAHLLGLSPGRFTQGRMTYDLRRLRLHGLIERTPNSHRYRVTAFGFRSAMFLRRAYNRLFRTGLSVLAGPDPPQPASLRRAVHHVEQAVDRLWLDAA